jgi:autotransporter translocation and assembly factor TamB
VLKRILAAAVLAAVLISGGAVAFLRTEFVANNLCAYAVATIEEATKAKVTVDRCEMLPESGRLTIEGLKALDPKGRLQLSVARIFAQVKLRPILQRVELKRLEVDYPDLKLALDRGGQKAARESKGECLPDLLDRFELGRVQVRKASVDVRAGDVRVRIPRATFHLKGDGSKLAVDVATHGGSVFVPGREIGLLSTRAEGAVDLGGTGAIELTSADLTGKEASAFLEGTLQDLCHPHIQATARLAVPDLKTASDRLLPGTLKNVRGALSVNAAVSAAPGKLHVDGYLETQALALEGYLPGDVRMHFDLTPERVKADKLEIPVARGAVGGSIQLELKKGAKVTADLALREVELGELLRKLGQPHSNVTLRAAGRVQAKGTLSPLALDGEANLDVADFAILDRSYEKRGKAREMFEFGRGKLTTSVAVQKDRVELRRIALDVGGSRVTGESTFFTDLSRGMDLHGRTEAFSLDDFKGHIGSLPVRGKLAFDARVSGPYQGLVIAGSARVANGNLLELRLGDLTTDVTYTARTRRLAFDAIDGKKQRSRYRGRLALDFAHDATPVDAHLELADGWLHDLVEMTKGVVPKLANLDDADDVDGHLTFVLDAHGPVAAPEATLVADLDAVRLWGESFDGGSARLLLHGEEPRLVIEHLTLDRGKGRVRASGRFGPAWQLDINGRGENLDLGDLDLLRGARLQGPLLVSAHVGGVATHPVVGASLQFASGKAGRAELGDGDFTLSIDGDAMRWRGAVGTHEVHGEATLAGSFPYSCSATVRVPDLQKYLELLPEKVEVQAGSLVAGATAEGSLLDWRASTGAVTLSELKITRNEMEFVNDGAARIDFGPTGLHIAKLAVRAPYTRAELQGGRSAEGELDLRLLATIDGRLLPSLWPDVEHASGTVAVQAAVGGTLKAPTVLGNLRIEDASGSLRGIPVQARALHGSVSFSQDALVVDSLEGLLNNGEARLSGGMEMKKLVPSHVDVSAHLSEVNVKLRDDLDATFEGDLTLEGPPLSPTLGGSLEVSRLKYVEDLDLEKSLLDFSRRPPTPKVLTKSALLLRYDLDLHVGRGVRIENNLARTDLKGDLKVTGNSRALGLIGSVNTVHGAATFRGNEFQIEQGVLSFTDRQRIRPSFDVEATATIEAADPAVKEYKVRLHGFGTPGEPHLTLNSDPALSKADLSFLLTFGFVSTNLQYASFSANDAGLALGVEALNKVTGFSEEVRRFIPKNAILRDPNIDFASDFSVATNRLEPMARFSSHLVTDRLDLKLLEGLTTRRYRGVISYQLSDSLSTRLQLDNEHLYTGVDTDFGVDLHFKWEGD